MHERSPSIAIIGAGYGGLGAAHYLKRAGLTNLTILEKSNDVGGVWRENTYPGAACDVPSHLYSFSFEPTYGWSRRFPPQPEILDYLRHCAAKHDLVRHIRFGSEVERAHFDPDGGVWTIELRGGGTHKANVLISAVGQLHRPFVPEIPGRERFGGPAFHSARWDHGCALAGKRVGVIGTGASAAQLVPAIAGEVAKLTVFQRSPAWIWPKGDRAFTPLERSLLRTLPSIQRVDRARIFGVVEGLGLAGHPAMPTYGLARKLYESISKRMLREQVPDPELRAKLTPDYPMGCKRVLLTNDWLPALSRPNVEVVTDAIDAMTETGVRTADGTHRDLDVVIYGTGFAATDFLAPMDIRGVHGHSLRESWRGLPNAYLGMTVAGFPNFFILYGPNTNLGAGSIIYMLERQARYVTQCVERLAREDRLYVDVLPEVQRAYQEEMRRRSALTVFESGCHSWYAVDGVNTNNWIGSMLEYGLRTRAPRWRDFREVGRVEAPAAAASLTPP